MKLKIKIKEVKEEEREMTTFEEAVYNIARHGAGDNYHERFVSRCKNKLKEIGLSEDKSGGGHGNPLIGYFRTETIRDATLDEYRAWAYLQLKEHCSCTERKTSSLDCDDCFLSGVCIASNFKTANARFMFRDKEVILEVTE